MAKEPFLINPPKLNFARKATPIPKSLKSKQKKEIQELLSGLERLSSRSSKQASKLRRKLRGSGFKLSKLGAGSVSRRRTNPFGEEVIIVGNPVRRRRNAWAGDSAAHSRAAKKGWSRRRKGRAAAAPVRRRRRRRTTAAAPVRRRRRRRVTAAAPVRRRRRRRTTRAVARPRAYRRRRTTAAAPARKRRRRRSVRRNPSMFQIGSMSNIDIRKPATLVMPIAIGILANLAIKKVPQMLNLTSTWTNLAAKVGIVAVGGIFGSRFVGSAGAAIWTIVGSVTVATELINQFVPGLLAGIGDTANIGYAPMAAYPEEVSGLGAFPYEEQLGAYPYGAPEYPMY